jgi:tetrahydromethanopterin S-methyltransferase subunit G
MVVMARESWTDGRLDEFKESVNRRFDEVDKRFDQVDKRLDRIEGDMKELRQTMIHGFFVLVGINATSTLTLIGLMVGLKVF